MNWNADTVRMGQANQAFPEPIYKGDEFNGRAADAPPLPVQRAFFMKRIVRKISLLLSGQSGAHLISIAIISGLLAYIGTPPALLLSAIAAMMLVRFIQYFARGPKPVLSAYLVRKKISQVVNDEIRISVSLLAVCYLMTWAIPVTTLLIFAGVNLGFQIVWMKTTRKILKRISAELNKTERPLHAKHVVIVGTGKRAQKAADVILDSAELETSLVGFLDYERRGMWSYRDVPLIGHPIEASRIMSTRQVDVVIVAVEARDLSRTEPLFATAEEMGVPVCYLPVIHDPNITSVKPAHINGTSVLLYRAIPENQFLLFAKNTVDKIGALIGLVLFSPLFALVAVAIKLDSRGPVFFKQVRSGLNGRPFELFKFRTMCHDAEKIKHRLSELNEMSGPVFKIRNDPRITRVGRILRKTSIDEVPQFINVLLGHMSLVGPRPPLPDEVARFEPWQRRKLSVKPGVTCTWQVGGRNDVDFEEWMRLDLKYIDTWSLWEDTKIIARTIPAVIKGSGAS